MISWQLMRAIIERVSAVSVVIGVNTIVLIKFMRIHNLLNHILIIAWRTDDSLKDLQLNLQYILLLP